MKPGPPLSSETAPKTVRILQRGWSGFRGGVGVKPEAPVPVSWRLIWGVLVKQGWSGFQRGRGYETGGARAFRNCPSSGVCPAAGVVWVSRGRVCETWAAPVWVVVGVCETWASRAFRNCPSGGAYRAAGVVWVSVGARVETWAAPVWVVVGVRETWASRACFMAPDMGSFGEAGVVWVSAGVWV